jgi:hypothetical protein
MFHLDYMVLSTCHRAWQHSTGSRLWGVTADLPRALTNGLAAPHGPRITWTAQHVTQLLPYEIMYVQWLQVVTARRDYHFFEMIPSTSTWSSQTWSCLVRTSCPLHEPSVARTCPILAVVVPSPWFAVMRKPLCTSPLPTTPLRNRMCHHGAFTGCTWDAMVQQDVSNNGI